MKSLRTLVKAAVLLSVIGSSHGQTLAGNLSFSVSSSFSNGVKESNSSVLVTDNNLTDGYASGFDLTDAPASLKTTGPAGSSAFQWGTASSKSSYPHASALWVAPTNSSNISVEQSFKIADLYYRNGTIVSNTGASAVDLQFAINFTSPSGLSPINVSYTLDLINTTNTSDPVASADIVKLANQSNQISYTDANGNHYYIDLNFKPDAGTVAGTMSTSDQFHVTEGSEARAELWGRITTSPMGASPVPEPSALLLGGLSSLLLFRRRRA